MIKIHQRRFEVTNETMALSNNRGLYFTKLFLLAVILEFTCEASEILNGENQREILAFQDQPQVQDLPPLIVLPDNYFEKRSNLNKFKSKL